MKFNTPKPMINLIDKPMIYYLIDNVKKIVDEVIVVINESIDLKRDDVKVVYQTYPLGTADALKYAIPYIKEKGFTYIIPADTPLVDKNILDSLKPSHDLSILISKTDNPKGLGRIKGKKIIEERDLKNKDKRIKKYNTGIYLIKNECLKYVNLIKINERSKEYYLTDLVKYIKDFKFVFIEESYKIKGANNLIELKYLEDCLIKEIIKKHLLNGVKIDNSSIIGNDALIDSGVEIINSYILGNSRINENTIIISSRIIDSHIGSNCQIGPFSHIKMNSFVGNSSRIGNFVEVKNSKIDNFFKASHLSYIGDSEIGENVNFGCGSITVNYDGKNKHKTIIGNNSFIGSNSNLIAPIKLGCNTFVACGTTLTKDLDDYDFSISRPDLEIKRGYNK